MRKAWISVSIAACAQALQDDGTCLAIVLGGGANNGAWEAGVIYGLVNYGDPKDYQWDVVAGVSIGGAVGFFISLFAKGDEVAMANYLSDFWLNGTTD